MTAPHFYGDVWQRKDRQCFVTIPRHNPNFERFKPAATVIISLADEPAIRMRSTVRNAGNGKRYAKIMRRRQAALADQFTEGQAVRVELVEAPEDEADDRKQEQIAKDAREFLEKERNCGGWTYPPRSELHERKC